MTDRRSLLIAKVLQESRLPGEYQAVEYIQRKTTAYINTGYAIDYTKNTVIKATFKIPCSARYMVCGTYDKNPGFNFELNTSGNGRIYTYTSYAKDTVGTAITPIDDFVNVVLSVSAGSVAANYQNETVINENSYLTGSPNFNVLLFTDYPRVSNTTFGELVLKKLSISEEGVLVRNFVSCYQKSNQEVGLYDKVHGVFYRNAGTGTFLKGADVDE
ncbi:MAG: hypothetical protein IKI29_01985 [Clostridia bacterium]|nr:hypothetical protein [Clostridia bacterium]